MASRISTLRTSLLSTRTHLTTRSFSALAPLQRPDSSKPKSTKGLSPKILNENPPEEKDQSEETKAHNKEMESRRNKPVAQIDTEDAPKDKEPPRRKDGAGS